MLVTVYSVHSVNGLLKWKKKNLSLGTLPFFNSELCTKQTNNGTKGMGQGMKRDIRAI